MARLSGSKRDASFDSTYALNSDRTAILWLPDPWHSNGSAAPPREFIDTCVLAKSSDNRLGTASMTTSEDPATTAAPEAMFSRKVPNAS